MKNKIFTAILIIVGIIALLLVRTKYSDYNLKKTVSACVMAQRQISKSFDREQSKKDCEEKIKKQIKGLK